MGHMWSKSCTFGRSVAIRSTYQCDPPLWIHQSPKIFRDIVCFLSKWCLKQSCRDACKVRWLEKYLRAGRQVFRWSGLTWKGRPTDVNQYECATTLTGLHWKHESSLEGTHCCPMFFQPTWPVCSRPQDLWVFQCSMAFNTVMYFSDVFPPVSYWKNKQIKQNATKKPFCQIIIILSASFLRTPGSHVFLQLLSCCLQVWAILRQHELLPQSSQNQRNEGDKQQRTSNSGTNNTRILWHLIYIAGFSEWHRNCNRIFHCELLVGF